MARRRWYSGVLLISKTAVRTLAAFRNHRLGIFVPFVVYLLFGSVLLWLISSVTPLAPFVYSLF